MQLIKPVFKAGLGGRLGSGRQWMSCIEVDDLASMAVDALHNVSLSGPLNAVMPSPVTNADFTKAAAKAAHRPALFPAPSFALRLGLGDLSHLLLDSQRILPKRFQEQGFAYRFKDVDSALCEVFR
jgi:NAD dependent epimerase/dehydratase family enzyme